MYLSIIYIFSYLFFFSLLILTSSFLASIYILLSFTESVFFSFPSLLHPFSFLFVHTSSSQHPLILFHYIILILVFISFSFTPSYYPPGLPHITLHSLLTTFIFPSSQHLPSLPHSILIFYNPSQHPTLPCILFHQDRKLQ